MLDWRAMATLCLLNVLTEFEDGIEVGREDTQGKTGIGEDELSASQAPKTVRPEE